MIALCMYETVMYETCILLLIIKAIFNTIKCNNFYFFRFWRYAIWNFTPHFEIALSRSTD